MLIFSSFAWTTTTISSSTFWKRRKREKNQVSYTPFFLHNPLLSQKRNMMWLSNFFSDAGLWNYTTTITFQNHHHHQYTRRQIFNTHIIDLHWFFLFLRSNGGHERGMCVHGAWWWTKLSIFVIRFFFEIFYLPVLIPTFYVFVWIHHERKKSNSNN